MKEFIRKLSVMLAVLPLLLLAFSFLKDSFEKAHGSIKYSQLARFSNSIDVNAFT